MNPQSNETHALAERGAPVATEIVCDVGPLVVDDAVDIMTNYLKHLDPAQQPVNDPYKCGKVACYWKAGIAWCNEVRGVFWPSSLLFPSWAPADLPPSMISLFSCWGFTMLPQSCPSPRVKFTLQLHFPSKGTCTY